MDSWRNEARFVLKALEEEEQVLFSGDDDHSIRDEHDKFVKKWGFSYNDMWDLHKSIAMFILPRMAYYCKHIDSMPGRLVKLADDGITELNSEEAWEQWKHILVTICDGLHLYIEKEHMDFTEEEQTLWLTAKKYLFEYFEDFWY